MRTALRYLRLFTSYCLFALVVFSALYHHTTIYLLLQGKGQFSILLGREEIGEYKKKKGISEQERRNLDLIEVIKRYSVDSLGYLPTGNFTKVYDQKGKTALWVITACEPFRLQPYYWDFPLVGKVTYKGFFRKELALKEGDHLRAMHYDVDIRPVTAWSTLGWFNDPIMSGMLNRKKGALCDLFFHELFHATYYAPSQVDFNENIACFVAEKATRAYLTKDTLALKEYLIDRQENKVIDRFMLRKKYELESYYRSYHNSEDLLIRKLRLFVQIADSVKRLPVNDRLREYHARSVLQQKNAYFVDLAQYNGMQDSLESVFNKFYKGDLKKLVRDLKQGQTMFKFDN